MKISVKRPLSMTPTMQSDPLIEPALPILASSLLDLEPDEGRKKCGFDAWKTGIKSLDAALPAELWTGGKVIGIHGSQDVSIHRLPQVFV